MKKIVIAAVIIVAVTLVALAWSRRGGDGAIAVEPEATTTTAYVSLKSQSWQLFLDYMSAVKEHDIRAVKNLSYQLSPTCLDSTKKKECDELMDNAYFFGHLFKLEQFKHMIYDKKQLILYGDYDESIGDSSSRVRQVLYFVRDGSALKFLSLNPFQGAVVVKMSETATSTIEMRLGFLTTDTDGDTLADSIETCTDQTAPSDCVKTDPLKKDTDGDGWWDSIEGLFYR